MTLKTAGTQSVTATDTLTSSITGAQGGLIVAAGLASQMMLSGATGGTAGTTSSATVKANDSYGNTATSYRGTVTFTSTDAGATLPAPYSFTSTDSGVHVFTSLIALVTAGTQSVTVTDPNGLTASMTGLVVSPGNANTFVFGATPTSLVVDQFTSLSVTARDAYGNLATGYRGTVAFTSSDANATLPGNYLFTAADNGSRGFTASLGSVGTYSLTVTDTSRPTLRASVTLLVVAGLSVSALSVGDYAFGVCALLNNQRIKCWGSDPSGNLGYGDTLNRGTAASQMSSYLGYVRIGASESTLEVGANTTSQSQETSCALSTNGSVYCWGENSLGQLGLGDTVSRTSPSSAVSLGTGRIATAIAVGEVFVCALRDDAQVSCWGGNPSGQLGLGDLASRSLPAGSTVALGSGRTAQAVAAGGSFACALLDTRQVVCWGQNASGQLGLGDTIQRTAPTGAVNLGAGRSASRISLGARATCAVLDNGKGVCWGQNNFGQLGQGDATDRSNPGILPALALGAGRAAVELNTADSSTCAILDTGSVKCWGYNGYGSLGYGDILSRSSPPGAAVSLGSGRTASQLAGGARRTCALLDTQQVACWGYNAAGALGQGDTVDRRAPAAAVSLW